MRNDVPFAINVDVAGPGQKDAQAVRPVGLDRVVGKSRGDVTVVAVSDNAYPLAGVLVGRYILLQCSRYDGQNRESYNYQAPSWPAIKPKR